jgi:hypothetical protein
MRRKRMTQSVRTGVLGNPAFSQSVFENLLQSGIITIYLFGQLNEKFNHRQIHAFIQQYWLDWFPALPSYQAFNRRLNLLTDNFHSLFAYLLESLPPSENSVSEDFLIDSMPVMLACRRALTPGASCTGDCQNGLLRDQTN